MDWKDRLQKAVRKDPKRAQQAEQGIDKLAHLASQRAGGKRGDQITKGARRLKDQLGLGGEERGSSGDHGGSSR